MRILMFFLSSVILSACITTATMPTTEEAMNLEAEQLVRLSLTNRLVDNVQSYNREQISSFLIGKGVPVAEADRIVDEELAALLESEHQRLIEALVPVYRRFYTADEIHQLLSFYKTDVARKSAEVSSQIAAEGREYIRLWNENFGELLLEQVGGRVNAAGFPQK